MLFSTYGARTPRRRRLLFGIGAAALLAGISRYSWNNRDVLHHDWKQTASAPIREIPVIEEESAHARAETQKQATIVNAPQLEGLRTAFGDQIEAPHLIQKYRSEVLATPHSAAPMVVRFAETIAKIYQLSKFNESEAQKAFDLFSRCIERGDENLPESVLANCLTHARSLAELFPGTLKLRFDSVQRSATQRVREMSEWVNP